jgi:uncharacterized protein with NAD-binding domain and iron-sulfur cluster
MSDGRRVAILGGGMAGLTAAWKLSDPRLDDRPQITVYERGSRLGGKGASSRGPNGRIEEHGLHVWLGYYDNAFALMREVYDELDRPASDPDCPIATWRDAFIPAGRVGVEDRFGDDWSHWVATFAGNDLEPGREAATQGQAPMLAFFDRGLRLLADFSRSIRTPAAPVPVGIVLSASPEQPQAAPSRAGELAALVRQAEIAAMVGAVESLRLLQAAMSSSMPLASGLSARLDAIRAQLVDALEAADDARRSWQLADLLLACMQGALRDGLITPAADFGRIDHLDFREWLARNGAREETLRSALVRGLYDLVFAYEQGDTARPRFSAGLGLFLATKLFFDYKGAIFWKLAAGMGDVVFAPLYEALRARGVRFEFFHRVDALRLDPNGEAIGAIELGRRARPAAPGAYEPLVRVKGLPCFASRPRAELLAGAEALDLESAGEEPVTLLAGRDFDEVVLATSLGIVPEICADLLASSPRWRAMVRDVATVPTQALQVWLTPAEAELGWPHEGATVSAYVAPLDTYASMTHTLVHEDWPEPAPRAVAYFCGVLGTDAAGDPAAAHDHVRANARDFLDRSAGHFWPAAVAPGGGLRWDLVHGGTLDAQYWRANVDPSDRYVQSLPGSARSRLRADASGFSNLVLAGDWVDCGLNAGCVEAAVLGGLQAANAVLRRAPMDGVLGSWCGFASAGAP